MRWTAGERDALLWDSEIAVFGLRTRASGRNSWIVVYRRRGEQKWLTLGTTDDLGAAEVRSRAQAILKDVATDGLHRLHEEGARVFRPRQKGGAMRAEIGGDMTIEIAQIWEQKPERLA